MSGLLVGARVTSGLLVVGGGPAGLAAARGFRDSGGESPVQLISADLDPPYARPPLTKDYLRGESGPDDLPLVESSWYAEHGVELRLGTAVTALARSTRQATLDDGTVLEYDRLVLATGSRPRRLPVPGGDLPGLIHVRDRASGDALRALAGPGRRVVVVGSGFVGCEAAASLALTGTEVVLLTDEAVPHAARLGVYAGRRIQSWLVEAGVDVRTGDGAAEIASDGPWSVTLESGDVITADAVVVGGGAAPDLGLAERSGIALRGGGVAVDAGLATSDPHNWAAGDIAHAHNGAAGRALRAEHWGEAETMGEIAGANAAGESREWAQAPGFWSTVGRHTLKYAAWGDGYDRAALRVDTGSPGWAVWYLEDDTVVGVLASDWDETYERGRTLVEDHAPAAAIETR